LENNFQKGMFWVMVMAIKGNLNDGDVYKRKYKTW